MKHLVLVDLQVGNEKLQILQEVSYLTRGSIKLRELQKNTIITKTWLFKLLKYKDPQQLFKTLS